MKTPRFPCPLHVISITLGLATVWLPPLAADENPSQSSVQSASSSSSASIAVKQTNDEAAVTYNGREVWKGKVKKSIITVVKSVDGKDLAVAFDGRKVVWENVAGAGAQLEAERKEAAKRQKKPAGA